MIKVKHDSQYLSYILEDNTRFSSTGYWVLKKQEKNGFLPCSRITYNGHIKLLYPVSGYTAVSSVAGFWEQEELLEWMLRILRMLIQIQENGFLRVETVDVDLSHLFIEQQEKRVHVVALPVTVDTDPESENLWRKKLEESLISMVALSRIGNNQMGAIILASFRDHHLTLEQLYESLKVAAGKLRVEVNTEKLLQEEKEEEAEEERELYLVSTSAAYKVKIHISKDEFILGKKESLCDGVINVAPTVSRRHCRILKRIDGYYIEDLKSKNHTYVNGICVPEGEPMQIRPGDQIGIADLKFTIIYE